MSDSTPAATDSSTTETTAAGVAVPTIPPYTCLDYVHASGLLDRVGPDDRALILAAYGHTDPAPVWDPWPADTAYRLLPAADMGLAA